MTISKKDALHRARALKRAIDGSDLSFLHGLNLRPIYSPLLNSYILYTEGVSLSIRYDSKKRNASVENICRYESVKGWTDLTLPEDKIKYPPDDKQYGFTNYQYSVDDIDRILGRGQYFLRHVQRCDLMRLSRKIQSEMQGLDRLHKRGVLNDWQYRDCRKNTEKAIMFSRFPVKDSIRNVEQLMQLFRTKRMNLDMLLDLQRQMREEANRPQSQQQTSSNKTRISA